MHSESGNNPWTDDETASATARLEPSILKTETIGGITPLDAQTGVFDKKTVPDALYPHFFGQPEPAADGPEQYIYAILDAAKVVNLPELLTSSGLEHRCMFLGKAYDEMYAVAPWIVRLEEGNNFTRHLFTQDPAKDVGWYLWDKDPGIFVRSQGSLEEMWKHFRKFTKVQDEDGKWFYFRFWEGAYLLAAFEVFDGVENAIIFGESSSFIVRSPLEDEIKTVALLEGTERPSWGKLCLRQKLLRKFSQTTLSLNKTRMFESLTQEYDISRTDFEKGFEALQKWGLQDKDVIQKLFSLWLRLGSETLNQEHVNVELSQSRSMFTTN